MPESLIPSSIPAKASICPRLEKFDISPYSEEIIAADNDPIPGTDI